LVFFFYQKKVASSSSPPTFPLKKKHLVVSLFFSSCAHHQPEYLQLTFSRCQVFPNRCVIFTEPPNRANSSAAQPIGPHESSVSLRPGTKPVIFGGSTDRCAQRSLWKTYISITGRACEHPPRLDVDVNRTHFFGAVDEFILTHASMYHVHIACW